MPNMQQVIEALKGPAGQMAGRIGAGAVFGGALGGYANPYMFGYEDNPRLRVASGLLNAIVYGGLAGMGPQGLGNMIRRNPTSALAIPGSMLTGELAPVGINLANKATDAARELAHRPPTTSQQVQTALGSPEIRGIGAGAALAGLGGITSGLLRPRRESEKYNTSRVHMVKKDILTYLLPAMAAGGMARVR